MAQKSTKNFCILSSDLFPEVLDVRVKQGVEMSTDHHLIVCSPQFSKPWLNRKSCIQCSLQDQIGDPGEQRFKETVASSMATKFQQLSEVSDDIEMK